MIARGMVILLVLVLGLGACAREDADRPADWTGPVAQVPVSSHHFGTLFAGARDSVVFVIENTGGRDLELLRSREDCGCTKPSFDRRTIPPGGSARMTVAFEAPAFHGPLRKRIRVVTNDPYAEILEFELGMEGLGQADLSESIFDLDGVRIGRESWRRRIELKMPEGFSLTGIRGAFEAPFVRLEVVDGALELVIDRPWRPLLLRDYLDFQLEVRDLSGAPRLLKPQGIQLTGTIAPAPAFRPPRLDFGWVTPGEIATRDLVLEPGAGAAGAPAGSFLADEMIEVLPGDRPGAYRVRLLPGPPGALRRLLHFVDAQGGRHALPVFAMRIEP